MNWKSINIPPTAPELDSPHMGRALGRLLDLGLDSCFDQQVMEKSANTHPIEKKSANIYPIRREISQHTSHRGEISNHTYVPLRNILFNVLITASNRDLVHWVDRPHRKKWRHSKGSWKQWKRVAAANSGQHSISPSILVRSNHSEIMETFGGKETELVLAIHQGEHLGGLQVSKGVPQGPSRSPRGPWLFNELVKCGAWESCGRAQQGRWWVNKKEAPLLNNSQLMLTSVSNQKGNKTKICQSLREYLCATWYFLFLHDLEFTSTDVKKICVSCGYLQYLLDFSLTSGYLGYLGARIVAIAT